MTDTLAAIVAVAGFVVGAAPPTLVGYLNYRLGVKTLQVGHDGLASSHANHVKLEEVKTELNGRMTEFIQAKDDLSDANVKAAFKDGQQNPKGSKK